MTTKITIALTFMLAACGVDEGTPSDQTTEQEINGSPRGQWCWGSLDRAPCSTPTCRDPDCTALQYMCCDYGEIGQPIGCYFALDLSTCSV